MPTTSQPSAGTALGAGWTGLAIFRNEVELTATTLAAGTGWTRNTPGTGVNFGTDAGGRYLVGAGAGNLEQWSGNATGSEYCLFAIALFLASGSAQAIIDSDDSANRFWQFRMNSDRTVTFIVFDSGAGVIANVTSTATVSTTTPTPILARVRNVSGTYKVTLVVGTTATAETSCTGTPAPRLTTTLIALGDRLGGTQVLNSHIYAWGIFNRAVTDTELSILGNNGWAIYDAQLNFNSAVTLDDIAPTGAFQTGAPSAFSGNVTLDDVAPTGLFSPPAGTINGEALKSYSSGNVLVVANTTIPKVAFVRLSDMQTVLSLTNQTTNGSGFLPAVTNQALQAGTTYLRLLADNTGANLGIAAYTAT